MGELDTNDAVAFDDAYNKDERTIIYEQIGKQLIPDRWNTVRDLYRKNGIEADFRTYSNIGHGTDLRINNDLVTFFKKYIN
jgi:hypothetical protein